jgi:hypothetical protein
MRLGMVVGGVYALYVGLNSGLDFGMLILGVVVNMLFFGIIGWGLSGPQRDNPDPSEQERPGS